MTELTGTGSLIRLILRQERVKLAAWVAVLSLVPVMTAGAFAELYPTEASRQGLKLTIGSNPAMQALLGPLHDTNIGALTTWRMGVIGAVLVGIMVTLTVIRHSREEEETGRRELLGSTVVGRQAPLVAALVVTCGASFAIGAAQAVGLMALGLPSRGAVAFGLGFFGVGMSFAGLAALAAQLTDAGGSAKGIAFAVLGAFFMLRVAGDAGGAETLSWLSPIGWLVQFRPFADEVWWVLVLWPALALAAVVVSFRIASRRDVGAGLFATRSGRERAGRLLASPVGLAWRLHRMGFAGWATGLVALGLVYGSVAEGMGDFLEDSPQLREVFELFGGDRGITDAFFMAAVGVLALVASAYSIRSVLRLRAEEEALRAELVLSTALSRTRWASSHLLVGLAGPMVMLVVGGAVAGAAFGIAVGDIPGEAGRVAAASLVQVPAVWVITGVAVTLFGALPTRTNASWAVLIFCLLLGQLGSILQWPQWALNLSPFIHVPAYPAHSIDPLPLVILTVVAGALVAFGLAAFKRRDLPTV